MGANVAETEHRRAIGDDGDEIALRGQLGHLGRIITDHPRRCQRRWRNVQDVQDVVIADRDFRVDLKHTAVALAKLDRLFAKCLVLAARARLRGKEATLINEAPGLLRHQRGVDL